jgi:hypothetical protein
MSRPNPVASFLDDADMTGVHPELIKQVVRSYIGEELRLGLLPSMYRSALRSTLPELFPDGMSPEFRANAIYDAHVDHGYTLAEIARHLHRCPSGVSRIYRRIREAGGNSGM